MKRGMGRTHEEAVDSDYDLTEDEDEDDYYYHEEPGLGRLSERGKPVLLPGTRTMTKDFVCDGFQSRSYDSFGEGRKPHGKRASAARPKQAHVLVTKTCFETPFAAPEYEKRESFLCSSCFELRKQEDAVRMEFNKRKAAGKKEEAAKRHKATLAASGEGSQVATFAEDLRTLKADALKRLCEANEVMVSGTKEALIARLVNVKLHGRPGKCPFCHRGKIDFVFRSKEVAGEPIGVECRHMRGQGAKCPWSRKFQDKPETKAALLRLRLIDSPGADLANAGISF